MKEQIGHRNDDRFDSIDHNNPRLDPDCSRDSIENYLSTLTMTVCLQVGSPQNNNNNVQLAFAFFLRQL